MIAAKHAATKGRKRLGDIPKDATKKTLGHLHENASAVYDDGRDKLHQVARTLDQYIREQPLKSVLIAGAIGLLLGRFWKR